jgi:hypothetical protein
MKLAEKSADNSAWVNCEKFAGHQEVTMRWIHHAAVTSFCLAAVVSNAGEPQVVHNPYATRPSVVLGQPMPMNSSASPDGAWQSTVKPASHFAPAPTAAPVATPPVSRTLPTDRLQALRAAVQVRSTAEAYRGVESSARHDKTAAWNAPLKSPSPIRDEAVKPATWIADVPRETPTSIVTDATVPRLLSEVTSAHQEATRLTRNPYRSGDATTGPGNPLR